MAMNSREEVYRENRIEDTLFTLKELLSFPILKKARLLAGSKGLEKVVNRINILEAKDIVTLFRTGEFVVTTGYPYREEPQLLVQLISELSRLGVSALGIQTKRYMDELPVAVIEEAEKQGLPLIELSAETLLSDIIKSVMEQIDLQKSVHLVDLQNRIQGLTSLLLEGRGLFSLLDAMEESRGHPIAIVRANGRPWLSKSLRGADSTELRNLIHALHMQLQDQPLNDGFMQLRHTQQIYVKSIPIQGSLKQSYLVLFANKQAIRTVDALIVDRLSPLLGMELATAEAIREIEERYLDPFLQDWLTGKLVSEVEWKLRADVCGYSIPEGSQLCAVLVDCSTLQSRERLKETVTRLRSERIHCVKGILVTAIGEDLALLLPISSNAIRESMEDYITPLLNQLSKELRIVIGDYELMLYSGRMSEGSEGVPISWAQAKRSRHVAEVCGLTGEVVAYERLGLYSLLYMIPIGEEREQFLARFTTPLKNADRKGGGRLVETLEMFYLCNGNIKLTSEKLFAHYNTVVYRLDKIQTILGISLDDPEERLQLHLALKLGQITPSTSGA